MVMTADRLLSGVKRRISMPASQVLMVDADILAVADDVTKAYLVPILVALRQDYFVTSSLTPMVADQAEYDIPYRAVGRGLRDLKMVDASESVRDLALISIEDAHMFVISTVTHSFYFKGDKVVLVPTPADATSSLQFWWEQPPANLTTVSSAALITAISDPMVTVSTLPSTMIASTLVDFVKGTSGNTTLGYDASISSVASTTVTFAASTLPTGLAVGDYLSLAQTTPVIQLPNECYPLLESRTCRRILASVGDYDGARGLDDDIKEEEKNLKQLLEPRIQGEPKVILNRNGLLRGRRFASRRGLLF